jgi:hypothetical protein
LRFSLCLSAEPAAVFDAFPVLPERKTLEAAVAALLLVTIFAIDTPPYLRI